MGRSLSSSVLAAVALAAISVPGARAHPASGIVVDRQGQVFFVHSGVGVAKIDTAGTLSYIRRSRGGHWLCLDEKGDFARTQPKYFERVTPDGVKPALIFADGGAPLVANRDGQLYYASGDNDDRPGGLALTRETPGGTRTRFAPALTKALHRIDDGVTGLAGGPDADRVERLPCARLPAGAESPPTIIPWLPLTATPFTTTPRRRCLAAGTTGSVQRGRG